MPTQGSAVAVVGMAGRFPGAGDVEELWENLREGRESARTLSAEELAERGADPALPDDPLHVPVVAEMSDPDAFDASFFGFSHREAEILDPQHRVFLECAWAALEDAGYDPRNVPGTVSLYGGATISTYLLFQLLPHLGVWDPLQVLIANAGDTLTTRVAHKLGFKGSCFTVQCACSTSLVAVHLAVESLLNEECDVALAGGVSINVSQRTGYRYQEGSILSDDGHCRAFDARAGGTYFGSGVGIVVLKRVADALRDGDPIRALILGSASNNDGDVKVGYTAPGVDGQAQVISEALAVAGVSAETISYVEGHGTGTRLGDPVEVQALTRAFGEHTGKTGFCALGSVKSNFGHLDVAAGVAGLIKTVLALEHEEIPPSLHYEEPNPGIDFASSPVYVADRRLPWRRGAVPRRAGVSSFGIGGTNAHLVLEEAPDRPPPGESRPWQLLVLSAKTRAALDRATVNLGERLAERPDLDLADVAWTLAAGRRAFSHRRIAVCRDAASAAAVLTASDEGRLHGRADVREPWERPVVFMFSGQGAQHVGMGRGLYEDEPTFRQELDRAAEHLRPCWGHDLREILYPPSGREEEARELLISTAVAQPALFAVEHALAVLWRELGVEPAAMIGHSIGEYVAATLAGVFSPEDALDLVAARGALMAEMPPGEMLAVPLPEDEVTPLVAGGELALAAVNAPRLCVVSGPSSSVEELDRRLRERGVEGRRLHTSHAFHSPMMEPILDRFTGEVKKVALRPPSLPYVSNLSGAPVTAAEATDPSYWARHLRLTVRFADGVAALAGEGEPIFLEVGPGRSLTTLVKRTSNDLVAVASMRHPRDPAVEDPAALLEALGRLWLHGRRLDPGRLFAGQRRRRVSLPSYPFERHRYWIEGRALPAAAGRGTVDAAVEAAGDTTAGRGAGPASLHERPELDTDYVAPRGELERQIAEIWREMLGVDAVGVHDNFFDLGGHSLLATQIVSRLPGVELSVQTFFDAPTVAALAEHVEAVGRDGPAGAEVPLERISRDAELPLSFSQQRLWFLEQFEPGTRAFHLPETVRLRGRLDVAALEAGLREVARRHESLRTTFATVKGRPVQVVSAEPKLTTGVVDLRRLSPQEQARAAEALALRSAARTFDLERGPLLRTTLLALGEDEHVFLLNIHHLVFDRWSMGVFFDEMAALYAAFTERRPSPLPELAVQYADFAHWQRQRLRGERLESLHAYWRGQLRDAPGILRLPTDRPRPVVRTENGARCPVDLPADLVARLKTLGGARSATLFMVLLAALDVLLWRFTGQRDLNVGTVIAGRTRPELEGLVGYLLNTLVLRTRLAADLSFDELLGRARQSALGAYAHQDLPFEHLIEDLQPERELSFAPFFQVMLVVQNTPTLDLLLQGLEVERVDYGGAVPANSDWGFWLWEEEGRLGGYVEYNTDLFDATTVLRMLSQMETLLRAVAAWPSRRLAQLPLLPAATRQQLFVEWNDVPASRREELCFHQLFERRAAERPQAPALTGDELELTYGELNERANRLARRLRRLGVGPEDTVGVFLEYSPEMVIAVLGVMKSGGAFLPLDAIHARTRVGELVAGAAVRVLLTQESLRPELPPELGAEVLYLDSDWDDVAREEASNLENVVRPSNLVYMVYTSGTTGRPKAVMISHAALMNIFHGHTAGYALDAGLAHLQMASFSFDVFTGDVVRALGHGGRLVLCPRDIILLPDQLDAYMRRHEANAAEFVPAVIRGLMQHAEESGTDLRFLRLAAVASDVWYVREYAKLRRLAPAARVSGTYGVTEVNIDSTTFQDDPRHLPMDAYVPVGRPFAGNPTYLLDRHGNPAPPGAPAEMTIGGVGVARGYFGRPALTAEKFVPDAWSGVAGARLYKTGDRVRHRHDGNVEFLGRVDFQVKIRGFRIEPGEIEAILGEHGEVTQAVVLARGDSPGNLYLAAYVVAAGEPAPEIGELRRFLKERLPDYMVPAVFVFLDELPLTTNNKVDRRRLPAPTAEDVERREYVEPQTPIEETLAGIFAEITGATRVGAQDDFFELGGHSLTATQVISRIREIFEVELPVRKLFEFPVLETLALAVEEELVAKIEELGEEQAKELL